MGKVTALLAQRAQEAKAAELKAAAEARALRARFDEKLQLYLVLQVAGAMCATVFGVLLLPVWLVVGPMWAARYFKTLEARVTERSLEVRGGVWFRRETSVPLDKIQDLSLLHGPLLNALGLATLRIDTAGGAATPGASAAQLIGIIDAARFRDEVLARRDGLAAKGAAAAPAVDPTLLEIRDALLRIEGLLAGGRPARPAPIPAAVEEEATAALTDTPEPGAEPEAEPDPGPAPAPDPSADLAALLAEAFGPPASTIDEHPGRIPEGSAWASGDGDGVTEKAPARMEPHQAPDPTDDPHGAS
ncbi:MAG: PH domain-containing protein [Deltaproteobacteria bacterium]|nr:PH domain-containing protein [Deltaproteobacteria bacterium]